MDNNYLCTIKKPLVYFRTYDEANKLDNLIALCEVPCHRQEHTGINHHLHFNTKDIVFKGEINKVSTEQRETAKKVVYLLLNTDISLEQISKQTGLSYSRVRSIYTGQRWKNLYKKPPREVRPRQMTLLKSKERTKKVLALLLNTDLNFINISRLTGVERKAISNLYHGRTHRDLYEVPPFKIRPRK